MFNSVQSMVNELQHQQERLLDTAANISHELGVNQDHVKVTINISSISVNNVFPLRRSTLG